jgi:hypothetical protein
MLSFLLGLEFLDVELKFFAFQDVTISTAGLAWSGSNASKHTLLLELFFDVLFELLFLVALLAFLHVTRSLLGAKQELVLL